MQTRARWYGPEALAAWRADRLSRNRSTNLDVVLLTHPRDERDISMLYPFMADLAPEDIRPFAHALEPVCGEVIETPELSIGLMFLVRFADEMVNPRTRGQVRSYLMREGLEAVAATGARIVCLGGLLGSLSGYGKRLGSFVQEHGLQVTTGHSMTSVTVLQTYLRAVRELDLNPAQSRVTVLGAGSVGAGFGQLLVREPVAPAEIVLVDKPERAGHVEQLADLLGATGAHVLVDFTDRQGQLPPTSVCYDSDFLISAVSTPEVIDIDRVGPRTVLIDDSQPHCWSREKAWRRVLRYADIAPCEAGLVDTANLEYRAYFPFGFASQAPDGSSSIAWCCLAEGLAMAHVPTLPPTVGEPEAAGLVQYRSAFEQLGLQVAPLQCGSHFLPLDVLRERFSSSSIERTEKQPVAPVAAAGSVSHLRPNTIRSRELVASRA